jgi:hypothetical protein
MVMFKKAAVVSICLAAAPSAFAARFLEDTKKSPAPYRQTLHNYQNVQYFADFTIGGQEISGIFDTGSFELLVRSTRCAHCVHPTPAYDHDRSKSYAKNGTVTKHVFGSGPCISMMGYDTVQVGPDLVSKEQAFWEIVDHRIQVLDTAKFAAIVGIGPNFAYGNTEKTLLMSYGVTEFSVCLGKPSGSVGYLTWGSPENDELKREDLVTANVIGEHHWVTPLHDVTFSNWKGEKSSIPCSGKDGCAAIIDSGTSLIAAPGYALMQLSEMIPEIKEDCSNLHELPTLNFMIDGKPFSLPPQAYVMRVTGATMEADDIWDILFFKPKIRKVDTCMPAFMQIDMASRHGPIWILGMPFFRYYHTTFDRTKKQMHFAIAGEDCSPKPYHPNRTAALLETEIKAEQTPMEMNVDAMIPPTLSEQMDFPWSTDGEVAL